MTSLPPEGASGAELAAGRLRALGDLAGALVHDLANQLLAVLGIADVLRPHLRDETERRALDEMQHGARQGAMLGRALVRLLASGPRTWQVRPLRELGEDAVAVGRKNALRRSVELSFTMEGEPHVRIDVAEAVQALLHAILFGMAAGAVAVRLHGGIAGRAIAGGRERSAAYLCVACRGVDAEEAARAVATLRREEGMLVSAAVGADRTGLVLAALALLRVGGEVTAANAGGDLEFTFVWPRVEPG